MVRLSEMDSGSIVFAGRTGRGGKTTGGWVLRGGRGAGQSRRDERQRRCRGGRVESGDGRDGGRGEGGRRGWWLWREKDLRFFEKFSYGG